MSKTTKRIILIGDTHCGHMAGLTPPDFQWKVSDDVPARAKIANAQREFWQWYTRQVKAVCNERKPYAVFFNADAIDGRGEKSGSTELVAVDRNMQIAMAAQCIRQWGCDRHVFTRGTPYHTGEAEDFEDNLADLFDAKIGNHEWPEVNGLVFDLRHHVGSSSIPHGRYTQLAKQHLWNRLWVRDDAQPEAQVIVRSHVHYHGHVGSVENGKPWLAMTLPALQLANTKFGSKRCDGIVHVGFVVIDVQPSGGFSWHARIANLQHNKAQTYPI